jgi:hypothetical protein
MSKFNVGDKVQWREFGKDIKGVVVFRQGATYGVRGEGYGEGVTLARFECDLSECAESTEQPQPTGNGRIVLFEALREVYSENSTDEWIATQLLERAQMRKAKYGTWLRAHNGRNALQDALDEALDGLMYAIQLRVESPSSAVDELVEWFHRTVILCKTLMDERKSLTQTFNDLRAEFGQGWRDDNAD